MSGITTKSFDSPDEVRTPEKSQVEVVDLTGVKAARMTLQPGWRWSEHVKPIAKTKSCVAPHFQYHLAGILKVRMNDGSARLFRAGDVSYLPSGHDAWVVGKRPVVVVDFHGMTHYAKR